MLIIFFVVGLALFILGLIFQDYSDGWFASAVIGVIVGISAFMAIIVSMVYVLKEPTYDEKIAMYQEENTKIEKSFETTIKSYQDYEEGIFSKIDLSDLDGEKILLIASLYPELKANTLVQQQLDLYIDNTKEIKNLKQQKIDTRIWKMLLYFGK